MLSKLERLDKYTMPIPECGCLIWTASTDKKGYGFCIEDDKIAYDKPNWWNLPHEEKVKWYYFSEQEMNEYFITEEEDYVVYSRDQKLKELGI